MLTQVAPVKFTYEDFLLFPNDGKRHELLDGDHYVSPSPRTNHQVIVSNLDCAIGAWVRKKLIGRLFVAPYDVVLSDLDVVAPELVYVSAARASIITDDNIRGVPDLVVEILSPSSRKTDEVVKRKLYERHGITEYWVVDPELSTVKVYRLVSSRYVRVAELSHEAGDCLTSEQFPGLSLPLADIFEGCR